MTTATESEDCVLDLSRMGPLGKRALGKSNDTRCLAEIGPNSGFSQSRTDSLFVEQGGHATTSFRPHAWEAT